VTEATDATTPPTPADRAAPAARTTDLPAQHRHLVTQHQQLDILGCTATSTKDDETPSTARAIAYTIDNNTRTIVPNRPSRGPSEVVEPHTILDPHASLAFFHTQSEKTRTQSRPTQHSGPAPLLQE
jgi:hypothetical protein